MMVIITTVNYDPLGFVILHANSDSKPETFTRRLTRTATLDGKSSISDMGYTASDATIELAVTDITQTAIDRLEYLVQTYPLVNLSINNSVYEGALSRVNTSKIPIKIDFLVKQRLI